MTTIKKQYIAAMLAALLLVITGVKFFHSCNDESPVELASKVDQLSTNNHCAICEFHLTQDADLTIDHPWVNTPLFHLERTFSYRTSHFTSSIGLSFSDRGPPALL